MPTEDKRSDMQPEIVISDEDAWAYTSEHLAQIEQAQADIRAGRVRQMSEKELIQFIEERTGEKRTS